MSDFDSDDDFDLDGFDNEFGDLDSSGSLGDLWRNNPFVKIGAILVGVALLIGIVMLFSGGEQKKATSQMSGGIEVTQTPGTEAVTENYRQAIEESNTVRLEEALRQNESAVPMPVEAPKGVIPLELDQPEEVDPLERWRKLQEEKVARAAKAKPQGLAVPAEPEVDTRTPAIQALSAAIALQMESILNNQGISGAQTKSIADLEYLEGLQAKHEENLENAQEDRQDRFFGGRTSDDTDEILLPAGTIEYAQLITEANTDVPGPILAEIMTGPLKGARLIGTFEETYDYLTLNFNTIVLDGVDYSADAVAIDPKTTLPGLATDINRRYFTRVILPVAADFITGYASALSTSGNTTITISGDTVTEATENDNSNDQEVALGVARAGEELASILDDVRDNNPQLLRVRSGTPMGILFVSAVTNNSQNGNNSGGIGGFNPITNESVAAPLPADIQ